MSSKGKLQQTLEAPAPEPVTEPVQGQPAERRAQPELDVSVIVPVQAVDAEVEQVFAALGGELDREGRSWECIFVFDGVRGQAYAEAESLAERYGTKLKIIALKVAFGESVCLTAGFERAQGRIILTSPQYVQVDPLEIRSMLAAIDEGADFVTPWRKPRIDPRLNRIQSACFNWVIRQIIRMEFHDLNCYFRAFRREVLDEVSVYGDMYRFLPVIAHRKGFRVVEVPVRHLKEWGEAHFYGLGVYVRRFLDVVGVMFLTKFTHRPLRFFGSLGALILMVGAFILAVVTTQWFFFGEPLYSRPIFTVGVMFFVLGVQVIGFGLVGEIIIYTQARNLREYRVERIYE